MNSQYEDKEVVCKDCGNTFTLLAGEQDFFTRIAEKENREVTLPKRCKPCRIKKKAQREAEKNGQQFFPRSRQKTSIFGDEEL